MGVSALLFALPALAFDPDTGAGDITALPDTTVLYNGPPPSSVSQLTAPRQPLHSPTANLNATSTTAQAPQYASPLPPMSMPPRPLYPARSGGSAGPVSNGAGAPPIPEATAQADSPVATQPMAPAPMAPVPTADGSGFIAPAPLMALPPPPAPSASVVMHAPIAPPTPKATVVVATPPPAALIVAPPGQTVMTVTQNAPAPASKLTPQTRAILNEIPSHLDTAKPGPGGSVALNRVTPEIEQLLGPGEKDEKFQSVGLSIQVRRPGLDTNFELNRAYTALMGNDTQTAIETYKNILGSDPQNQDALFGLAATYHRLGDVDKARPLYGMLLKINPNHREGLNNFLALVADESPQDALPELERLEQRNPDFSPIPAQLGLVMDKLGYQDQARAELLRAIQLAPDNLTYKYNLAVMLDHQGQYADASALYRLLITASLHGETVPAPTQTMQNRLNYISAQAAGAATPG